MANVDRPNGLSPLRYIGGSPYTGSFNQYVMLAATGTALYVGDLVDITGDSGAAGLVTNGIDCEGMPECTAATADSQPHLGVVVGFLPNQDNLSQLYRVASTARIALVADDPRLVFEIQEVSGGTAFTAAEVGMNAVIADGGGSTVTGRSGMELNNSGEATTLDLDLKILGLTKRVGNVIGQHAKWDTLIAVHLYESAGKLGVS